MNPLPTDLRKQLEKAVRDARTAAEQGARQALEALAVHHHEHYGSMATDERALRNRLRAHGRQLGDARDAKRGGQAIVRLVREVAYEHWHRMLFARFLAENHLLIEPESGVAITLEECEELARDQGLDPWVLAASFAQGMLPQIFRADDPSLAVTLPPETRQALQKLLAELPPAVFTADDALGWTYQFWQSAEKDAVNARVKSGEKITGETLPAVTQLFTEPYMVQFLLHNTIGAWHAGKVLAQRPELAATATSEQELRDAVALDGYAFDHLRFVREPEGGEDLNAGAGAWRPAAGTYPRWPRRAAEITVLDPCCGSGHFLVAAFDLLVRLRMAEEGSDVERAIRAVLAENLFGLELDARCTQIAAFNLAIAAWRTAGRVIDLPPLHVACSGVGPNATREEWLALAEQAAARGGMPARRDLFGKEESLLSAAVRSGLEQLYETFELAPELGSLIDPGTQASDLFVAGFEKLAPVLDAVLAAESAGDETHERAVAAQGMARAARILTGPPGGYMLVVTNVPYLGRGSQSDLLKDFAEKHHKEAKADLATIFVARMLRWVRQRGDDGPAGTIAAVTPQNWLFLTSYKRLRKRMLEERSWEIVARLGAGAFETIGGHVVNVALLSISGGTPDECRMMAGIDVSAASPPATKAALLRGEAAAAAHPSDGPRPELVATADEDQPDGSSDDATPADGSVRLVPQAEQMRRPTYAISFGVTHAGSRLVQYAETWQGLVTGDTNKFTRCFWEVGRSGDWEWFVCAPSVSRLDTGRSSVLWWQSGRGALHCDSSAHNFPPPSALGRDGVLLSQVGEIVATTYRGEVFNDLGVPLIPRDRAHLEAIYSLCESASFNDLVRQQSQTLAVRVGYFLNVPFNLDRWQAVAAERYPNGLPEPRSDDPTQWLFHGHPANAEADSTLQVGVARLVGYRWPAELDEDMRLAPEARELVRRCVELAGHSDGDGIVGLTALQGEGSAAGRLRSLLATAFGSEWTAAQERDLLRAAGARFHKGKTQRTLEAWLRDRFFEEHCALFHGRPFVWHVWDGRPDGFHALVNYHRLAGPDGQGRRTLEALTFTYLGEWIDRQRQQSNAGEEGADGRLAAAVALQDELRKILEGEPPFDIFVRWKPLHEQPLGWDPDINDGVRLNIRPFLMARDVGKKGAGILRAKPDNTWSNAKKAGVKDRGKEPEKLRPRHEFPWFWGCDPEAHSEHRTDFGAGTPGSAPAGKTFDGARWNGLHYTRAAKEAARRAAGEGTAAGAPR